MTEFWKSQTKHWCKVCKVFIDAKQSSIRTHEGGRGHKMKFDQQQQERRKAKVNATIEQDQLSRELAAIDRAAMSSFKHDLHTGAALNAAAPSSLASSMNSSRGRREYTLEDAKAEQRAKVRKGWKAVMDPQYQTNYYVNTITQETVWVLPEGHSLMKEEGEEEEEEPGAKMAKTEGDDGEEIPRAPVEIDEDTGIGKWESVARVETKSVATGSAGDSTTSTTSAGVKSSIPLPFSSTRHQSIAERASNAASQKRLDAHMARMESMGSLEPDADPEDSNLIKLPSTSTSSLSACEQFGGSSIVKRISNDDTSLVSEPSADGESAAPAVSFNFKKRKDRGGQKSSFAQ